MIEKTTVTFNMMGDGRTVSHVITEEAPEWMALVDEFLYFLKGCGYIVTHRDLIDYLDEVAWEPPEDNMASGTITVRAE